MTSGADISQITDRWTVNELLQHYPFTLPTLHELHIHTCCGGALTLAEAAANAGMNPDMLIARVQAVVDAGEPR